MQHTSFNTPRLLWPGVFLVVSLLPLPCTRATICYAGPTHDGSRTPTETKTCGRFCVTGYVDVSVRGVEEHQSTQKCGDTVCTKVGCQPVDAANYKAKLFTTGKGEQCCCDTDKCNGVDVAAAPSVIALLSVGVAVVVGSHNR